jgi:GTPase SAR1 family protein
MGCGSSSASSSAPPDHHSRGASVLGVGSSTAGTSGGGYKVVLLGETSVGKTSVLRRFGDNAFTDCYEATVPVCFRLLQVCLGPIHCDRKVGLYVWDTAGQERFHDVRPGWYGGGGAAGAAGLLSLPSARFGL